VRNVNELDVAMARWTAENTPADARLAVCDAGAIPYFSNRRVVDTVGIVTPGLLPYLEAYARDEEPFAETPLALFLRSEQPDYLIVFPPWYPNLTSDLVRLGIARKVKQITIEGNVTCGGATMAAYQLFWRPARPTPR
jgi:hypothetical protein